MPICHFRNPCYNILNIKISDIYSFLREWQRSKLDEIYVTVFPKHKSLIKLLTRFGFNLVGTNLNHEQVFMKSRSYISYENPYVSFPFVNPNFNEAGYLIFEDAYHDTMFPYSELAKDVLNLNILEERLTEDLSILGQMCFTDYVHEGYYEFKTNVSAAKNNEWYISSQIKVNRILSNEEVAQICLDNGVEPQLLEE